MKKITAFVLFLAAFPASSFSQDTFSICAYDSLTGQLGSAGATCIQAATSAIIISDIVAGKGVVHTQASWLQANKTYAHSLLLQGLTPQQIIDSVTLHDAQGNPTIRQYGVVDVNGASAAYTGTACLNYHNHITGPGYSIQGNILLGQQILDSMESRFLNTPGDLACRLMAALQGAKVTGADTRCTSLGISSVSAFIRMANPGDTGTTPLSLSISVNTHPIYTEPIDSLQQLFIQWGGCDATSIATYSGNQGVKIYPNPAGEKLAISSSLFAIKSVEIYSIPGSLLTKIQWGPSNINENAAGMQSEIDLSLLQPGFYFLRLQTESGEIISTRFVKQ